MKRLTLTELQQKIKEIDGLTIGDSKISDRCFMKFIEEVGELSECIRKDKSKNTKRIKKLYEKRKNYSKKYMHKNSNKRELHIRSK